MSQGLQGKIAVVTGSSRGIGKGIALSLGEAGATVYVVARTGAGHPATVPLSGTVEETAAEITQRGGVGIPARCDLRSDDETEALFARVKNEHGQLDILVNCAWAGYEGIHDESDFPMEQRFWERPLTYWDRNLSGLRAAYTCSVLAARMMAVQQ
ncbi:MAG: SDR family NAD(P)-dependent oxidoreductase, partial [Anaerolineae bacterium]|nr:SDR family NAD(P)-dependent oxidoreductase [Anaerolineae bacterium]